MTGSPAAGAASTGLDIVEVRRARDLPLRGRPAFRAAAVALDVPAWPRARVAESCREVIPFPFAHCILS